MIYYFEEVFLNQNEHATPRKIHFISFLRCNKKLDNPRIKQHFFIFHQKANFKLHFPIVEAPSITAAGKLKTCLQ